MKKLLLTILFCLIPCVLFAGGGFTAIMAGGGASGAAPSCASCQGAASCTNVALGCTARETFDGSQSCIAGDDPDETNCSLCASGDCWAASVAGTIDFTDTNYPLYGTNAMSITGTSASYRNATNFTAVDTMYAAVSVYVQTANVGVPIKIVSSAAAAQCSMSMASDGSLTVLAYGGSYSATIATASSGNRYYLKIKYVKGTGADAVCQGWVSTDGTTWTTTQSSTDGTSTAQAARVYLGAHTSSVYHFDDLRVYTGDISW